MPDLAEQSCVPCRGGIPPLAHDEIERYRVQVERWDVIDDHHLVRRWDTKDFAGALALAHRFGEIAEAENHHPVLSFSWGWIEARIWTHRIDGLTASDFVLAAKFDRVAQTNPRTEAPQA